jgi:hypothetical protein
MNQSYLNSMSNTVSSIKPSRAIHLLLMVLFVSSKKINPSNFKFLISIFFLIGFGFNGLNAQCTRPETPSPEDPIGLATPCEGSTVTYSITSSKYATSYSWFYPSDWIVLSGATTKEITFKIGQSSGNVGVFGVNACGRSYDSSQRNIQIIRKPSTPGQPSSYNASCNGFTAQWGTDGTQVNYLVDVSTDPNFSSFVAPYQGYNAGNVQNIVLTGLVSSTTYYYRIRRSSSCGISDNYSPSNFVTTSPGGAGGAVTGGGAVCSGDNSGLLTLSGHSGTVQKWQSSVSPFIIWSDISNTKKTYTSTALSTTTQFRAVVLSNSCTTYSTSKTVTVSSVPSAPIVGIITQPTCATATASVVLSGLPAGNWMLTRNPGNVKTTGSGTTTTISGLASGTSYTFSVVGIDNGLRGEYFNNMILSGTPALTRTDAKVEFDWGTERPDASINSDNFSVRWSGQIQALHSQYYTFTTRSDDGIRLWVNGVQIIDNWSDHGAVDNIGGITLAAGVKYDIVLEYYENGGDAVSQLSWSDSNQPLQIIPTSQLFPYADCSSVASANVIINAQPASTVAPTGTAAQSFCSGSTVANLSATGTAIKWYTASSGGTALASTTVLTNGTHYYATQTLNSCESAARFDVTATVTNTATPTGTAAQSFCSGSTVANLSATGTAIKWYTASSGGTALVSTTVLTNGTHYYATQTLNGCESTSRLDVTAIINSAPSAPIVGVITQPTCATATASVALSGLPAGNWMLTRSPGNVTTTGSGTTTTISGLASGTSYTFSVVGIDNGLKGAYFNNMTLSGTPVLTRTDTKVDFDWVNGNPGTPITNDNFSVRWSGQIKPVTSQNYTFTTTSDDGVRLWLNGTLIIDNWTVHSVVENSSVAIPLTAGVKYNIVLEFYENGGQAVSKLSWSSASQAKQIIPNLQLFPDAGCSSPASANVVINAQPATPTTPTVGTPTQPNCKTPTGTVKVTSPSPAAGITYTITGTNPVVAAVTNTTGVFSGLAAGNYNVATTNGCTSSPTTVVIKPFVENTNTWNGTAWSTGLPPNAEEKLVFAGNYPPAEDPNVDIEGCSCMVSGGKKVTIKSGKTLTITNEVTVVGGGVGAGSLIFENNASLVQINNTAINSGDIEYQRSTSTPVLKTDYVYWSSPVFNQKLGELSPKIANGTFYSFDTGTEDWNSAFGETTMDVGKGYIVRRPDFISGIPVMTETYTASFEGEPNNGIITFPSGFTGAAEGTSNLLGNPYPSAIDADKFLAANAGVLDGTLYFWTHNTALNLAGSISNPGPGWAYTYSLDDYASYNITGGVATAPDITASAPSDPDHNVKGVDLGKKPTGKIAAGQGFFATSKALGNVTFNNDMRLSSSGAILDNTQFFKTKNPKGKTANTIEKNRVWLNLTNTLGAFKQTLIGYVTDATNEYDSRFDGESFDANEYLDFYSVHQEKNLVIQGRALPFDATDEVQLGYRTTINGEFTINIDQVDGVLTNQTVFIEDKLTNTIFDLKTGNYTFSTTPGTFNDRFVLKYSNKTLSVDQTDKVDGILAFYSNNYDTLIIHNENMDSTVDSVSLFNMTGQNIGVWDVRNSEQTNIQIPIKKISSGIYIVKVKTTIGESSKKIIVN